MEHIESGYLKEFSQGFRKTTNNRMELMAVVEALNKIKKENAKVTIYTDSKYVSDSVEKKWVFGWQKNNFKKKKNIDLWIKFLKVYEKHSIKFIWIKGHNNHPQNERCDKLAVAASKTNNPATDSVYEQEQKNLL
jgi:ribonuclease HI